MINKQNIADFVLSILNQNDISSILLRGTDDRSRSGGDIDFVVKKRQSAKAAMCVGAAAAANGWAVVGYRHLGYVAQLCLLIPASDGIDDIAIKIDISDGMVWYALGEDPLGEAIFRMHREGGRAAVQAVGIATYLQKMLYPGFLRHRDMLRVFGVMKPDDILTFCFENNLPISIEEIETGILQTKTRWKIRAASANVHGLKMLPWIVTAIWLSMRARLGFSTNGGQIIGMVGTDRNLKSMLADRLVRAVVSTEFTRPELVHLLPDGIPRSRLFSRMMFPVGNYASPHSESPLRLRPSILVKLGYYILAFAGARLWCNINMARGKIIILDRCVVDFIVDLERVLFPQKQFPHIILKLLLPKGIYFYINAKPDNIVAHRPDLPYEQASKLTCRYLSISKILNIFYIDGGVDRQKVFNSFVAAITVENVKRVQRSVI